MLRQGGFWGIPAFVQPLCPQEAAMRCTKQNYHSFSSNRKHNDMPRMRYRIRGTYCRIFLVWLSDLPLPYCFAKTFAWRLCRLNAKVETVCTLCKSCRCFLAFSGISDLKSCRGTDCNDAIIAPANDNWQGRNNCNEGLHESISIWTGGILVTSHKFRTPHNLFGAWGNRNRLCIVNEVSLQPMKKDGYAFAI